MFLTITTAALTALSPRTHSRAAVSIHWGSEVGETPPTQYSAMLPQEEPTEPCQTNLQILKQEQEHLGE